MGMGVGVSVGGWIFWPFPRNRALLHLRNRSLGLCRRPKLKLDFPSGYYNLQVLVAWWDGGWRWEKVTWLGMAWVARLVWTWIDREAERGR